MLSGRIPIESIEGEPELGALQAHAVVNLASEATSGVCDDVQPVRLKQLLPPPRDTGLTSVAAPNHIKMQRGTRREGCHLGTAGGAGGVEWK